MKNSILSFILGFAVALLLFSGVFKDSPAPQPLSVEAQSTSAKANLISLIRADATAFLAARASFKAHKASYDGFGFSWVDGDFTGANAGITATVFTTGVSNLDTLFSDFDAGGTLPAGLPTGVNRIASQF